MSKPYDHLIWLIALSPLLIGSSPMSSKAATIGNITVVPNAGPAGAIFTVLGSNFPPGWAGARLQISIRPAAILPDAPPSKSAVWVIVGMDGGFQAQIDSTGFAAGQYTIFVWSQNAPDRVLTEAALTIVADHTPRLPASGDGGLAARSPLSPWGIGVSIATLVALGWRAYTRRHRGAVW